MGTKFGRLEFSGKTFSFTKSSITKTREKWDPLVLSRPEFWLVWRCHGILFVHFYFYFYFYFFCLEATLGQDRATSATVIVIFSKVPFRKLLYHSYVKVSSQQLRDTSTTVFWRTPYGWRFYGHGSRYVLILSSRL